MPYTLLKFLLWFALAGLIGGVIGWLLRSLKCRAEVADARAATVDDDDVERMRHRLANLETVVAERDRLRMQVADLRAADSPGVVGAPAPAEPDESEPDESDATGAATDDGEDESSPADDATESPDDESIGGETDEAVDASADAGQEETEPSIMPETPSDGEPASESTEIAGLVSGTAADSEADVDSESATVVDLDAAASALGKKIKLDDLTVVEGIGPKISELCGGINIATWRQLADTDVVDLRSMLDAAGPRYQIHDPGSWPRQAELLATGQWEAFKTLTDELDGGR